MADALMLGVSGLRGVVGTTLTPEVASRFAGTVGSWLREQHKGKGRPVVVLARDGRAGGVTIRNAASAGLMASGCDVLDLGVSMTPTAGVVTDLVGAAAGIVITASHNPQQWNGLKVLYPAPGAGKKLAKGTAAAAAPSKATADAIIARYHTQGPSNVAWDRLGQESADDEGVISFAHVGKIVMLLKDLGIDRKIRAGKFPVVLDSVNSSGQVISPTLLDELGCRLTHLGGEPTGLFPHTPEPIEANLGSVCRAVKKSRAAVGFCQDPDADRLALIDENGRFIGEEYTLVLAARALIKLGAIRKGQSVAVNLSTSRMVDDVARAHKFTVIRTPVGEANVVEAMKSAKSPLGGEGNGGVIWPAVTYIRDSLGAMGLALALMAITKKPLSKLVDELPAYAIVKRKVDLACKEDARPAVEKVAKTYKNERVDLQDGVRVDFDSRSAWVHVRASNTEPIMRLIAEAPTREAAEGLLDEVAGVIG